MQARFKEGIARCLNAADRPQEAVRSLADMEPEAKHAAARNVAASFQSTDAAKGLAFLEQYLKESFAADDVPQDQLLLLTDLLSRTGGFLGCSVSGENLRRVERNSMRPVRSGPSPLYREKAAPDLPSVRVGG